MSIQVSVHPHIQAAIRLCARLQAENHEAYWVGGAVRDLLLHPEHAPLDIDIATSAPFSEVCKILPMTRAIGKAFGVGLVTDGDSTFEVATFRKEGQYTDRRHPSEVGAGTLEEDSERRDFSINALYFDPVGTSVIDFHNGVGDLGRRVLRTVGQPHVRLHEDPLRILRLFRFAAKLDFKIDSETLHAALALADDLKFISRERILLEVSKLTPESVPAFARWVAHVQSSLIGPPRNLLHTPSSDALFVLTAPVPDCLFRNAGTLFAMICASNENIFSRNWKETFKDWPFAADERAHLELFQKISGGDFVMPADGSESTWKSFLEQFRWLQRQSRISATAALWLAESVSARHAPPDETRFILALARLCHNLNADLSLSDCIESAIRNKAAKPREEARLELDATSQKTALGWARLMIDCGILFKLMGHTPRNAPDFLQPDPQKEIAAACEAARRWSEDKVNSGRN